MTHSMDYVKIKTANEARMAEEQRTEQMQKSVLVLILDHLHSEGYHRTAEVLEGEGGVSLAKSQVCDNIDLMSILREFEAYYAIKFGKPPKLIKKVDQAPPLRAGRPGGRRPLPGIQSPRDKRRSSDSQSKKKAQRPSSGPIESQSSLVGREARPPKARKSSLRDVKSAEQSTPRADKPVDIGLSGVGLSNKPSGGSSSGNGPAHPKGVPRMIDLRKELKGAIGSNESDFHGDKLLKPIGSFGYDQHTRELAEVISRDIFTTNPNVRWTDIIGLESACRLAKEAVVYPIKYPSLFQGLLSPWKGLLLYGPPGTGKTMLAKAVATESKTTFFNISSSSIVSKWRGDSEKLVRVLFELARYHAPSTIFLDELDSIMSTRGGTGGAGDHEGSRRMKTELLVQMDGLSKSDDLVFLLAASNLPWELDPAMLRRLEKRILVDMPCEEARKAMFLHYLPEELSDGRDGSVELRCHVDYQILAEQTDGYSGSDIKLVCKEAAMRVVRKVFSILEELDDKPDAPTPTIRLDPLTTEDVLAALASTKPSAKTMQGKYKKWQSEFESS